jgi:N-acetylglucosaminyldiphosphoundecaprenol N-acetyl-beta-D-mannosaminyltransferase
MGSRSGRIDIMGIPVDGVTIGEALEMVKRFISEGGGPHMIVTPNSLIANMSISNGELREAIASSCLSIPDGWGIVWASRILGSPIKERVAGIDLMVGICKMAADMGYKVFLLGGKEGVAERAAEGLRSIAPGLIVVGTHHGYFSDDGEVLDLINKSGADILFVAMGAPKQELWMWRNRDLLKVSVVMGVGGSFDVLAGVRRRAPEWIRRSGLEWLYRFITNPTRIERLLVPLIFGMRVIVRRARR